MAAGGHERDAVDVIKSERRHSILRQGLELCAVQTDGGRAAVARVTWIFNQWFGRLFGVKHYRTPVLLRCLGPLERETRVTTAKD
jgi:hypothetical protein